MDDTRYISLEKKIDGAECDGLRARWECGLTYADKSNWRIRPRIIELT